MTIGERIRFFRKRMGITQEELARRADLHPVSIRKYETNKMTPQYEQLVKMEQVLEVNHAALVGIDNTVFSLRTLGDFLGIVIVLCQSRVIMFDGKRREDGLLEAETACIKFSEKLDSYVYAQIDCVESAGVFSLNKLAFMFDIKDILPELLCWEREYYRFRELKRTTLAKPTRKLVEEMKACEERKEILELELQNKKDLLMWPDGLAGDIM